MRFAEILVEPQPSRWWKVFRQVGVEDAVGILPRGTMDWRGSRSDLPWDLAPLQQYQEMVESTGLHLTVIEDNPPMDHIRRGTAGAEEELYHVETLLRSMGRLGIKVWCYNWSAVLGWMRTSRTTLGRGGAVVTSFDNRNQTALPPPREGTVDEEPLWDNLRRFLERVVPVAEEVGVTLAMHPDDPPLSPIRGVARIMRTPEAFERLVQMVPSPANAITFCQGNFTLMTDDVPKLIRQFGAEQKIAFVHFRDVRGTPDAFVETFHDEGQTDMFECMRAYRDIGFSGPARTDHTPTLEGDYADVAGYSSLGRLQAIGYMTGLREAALKEVSSQNPDAIDGPVRPSDRSGIRGRP